jgi:5-methyltetrahydropteroyltriglutamate--homocysteine methyltransferase
MTTADTLLDEHYHTDPKTLAMRFAGMLNREAKALVEAGVDVIQFDEPCFNIYLDRVQDWGIEALERCIDGVAATTAVHICYGYGVPNVLAWKTQNHEWGHYAVTLPLLAKSGIGQVSVETAASGVDVSVLQALQGKDVLLGVIDVGTEEVEAPDQVAERIRRALPYVSPEHLYPCTDCGLVPRSREAARGKLHALAQGAAIVRDLPPFLGPSIMRVRRPSPLSLAARCAPAGTPRASGSPGRCGAASDCSPAATPPLSVEHQPGSRTSAHSSTRPAAGR